ncbi:MAG: Rpn family recombination-promoting nuclease/putative transposase, partial [Pseudomonadota bacterium]
VDPDITLRVQQYIFSIVEDLRRQSKPNEKLPLIYPMLFYIGKGKYNAPRSLYELFDESVSAKEYMTQDSHLIDVEAFMDRHL